MNNENDEILNTLEEKKFISNIQLEKIKDELKLICDSDFKGFYEHYKDYYNHKKKLSFKQFVNILIDYLVNETETEQFKIFDDYFINQLETENRVYSFSECLEHESTEDLKNYDLENKRFIEFDCFDNDIIEEDTKNCLNLDNTEYNKLEFENSCNITYLKLDGFDLLTSYAVDYDNFKELFEDLENLVNSVDLKEVYIRFILDNNLFKSYLEYDNKGLIKLDKDIKKSITKIFNKRLEVYEKDLKKFKSKKYRLSSELKQDNKPLIVESIKVNIEKIENHIKLFNSEIKLIKDKNGK